MQGAREAFIAFAVATALVAVAGLVARGVPLIAANLGAVVAVVFLVVPYVIVGRRNEDLYDYGFHAKPLGQGLGLGLGGPLIILPIFAVVYVFYYDAACAKDAPSWLATLPPPGQCVRWDGWAGAHLPAARWDMLEEFATQIIVVALPEELFFRGYVHKLLERTFPAKRKLWGGGIGVALVLSSALFAAGHLAVNFDPRRLAVFFPGLLFGWMRSKTDSIFAGVLAHALSNVFIFNLDRIFF